MSNEISIRGLRKSHFDQLMTYIEDRECTGWYYGNRKQYEKRHAEIKAWVQGVINYRKAGK